MGGAPSQNNELLMDGAPNSIRGRTAAYNPPMDAVLEVKVEAFQSDAAFGNTGGGTVNLVSKAGTNRFHGGVYEYNQVGRLAATPFFINRAGQKKPFMLWNQYGVHAGRSGGRPEGVQREGQAVLLLRLRGHPAAQPAGVDSTPSPPTPSAAAISRRLLAHQLQLPDLRPRQRRARRRARAAPALREQHHSPPRLNPIALKILQYFPLPNQPGGVDGRNNLFTNAPQMRPFQQLPGPARLQRERAATRSSSASGTATRNSNEQSYFHNIARGRNLRDSWGTTARRRLYAQPHHRAQHAPELDAVRGNTPPAEHGHRPDHAGFSRLAGRRPARCRYCRASTIEPFDQLGESNAQHHSVRLVPDLLQPGEGPEPAQPEGRAPTSGSSARATTRRATPRAATRSTPTGRAARWIRLPRRRSARIWRRFCWGCPPAAVRPERVPQQPGRRTTPSSCRTISACAATSP